MQAEQQHRRGAYRRGHILPEIKGNLIGPVQIIKEDEQTTFSAGSGPDEIRDDLESARLTLLRVEGAND